MHDDALKQLWNGQQFEARPALPDEAQIAAMKKRMKRFDKTIQWRDYREVAACVVVFIFFGWHLLVDKYPPLMQAGCAVLVGSAAFVAWKLIGSKRRLPKAEPNAPVCEVVKVELQKVENQIGLLESVAWWYLLPLFVGVMLCEWGTRGSFPSKLIHSTFALAIYAFIYGLNQWSVKKYLLPLKRGLEASLNPQDSAAKEEPKNKKNMIKLMLIGFVLVALGAMVFVRGSSPKTPAIAYSDPVSQMLESIREKHDFPALAAAVVVDGKIVLNDAVGFRKNGGTEKVAVDDKFHLGSVTKSMTAAVAAMLVEQGKISWTTTIGEAFPELQSKIHPDYLGVTLEQLLTHRSGAPGDAPGDLWRDAWTAKGTAAEQRLAFTKGLLARKPEAKPGTKFIYSNQGYTIAGVMLEKATGKSWEDLLRSMLFEPLGMTTAGFGAPASVGKVDQPWGQV